MLNGMKNEETIVLYYLLQIHCATLLVYSCSSETVKTQLLETCATPVT
jgi:hypothetical protein